MPKLRMSGDYAEHVSVSSRFLCVVFIAGDWMFDHLRWFALCYVHHVLIDKLWSSNVGFPVTGMHKW